MLIFSENEIFDQSLNVLSELYDSLDEKLSNLSCATAELDDPDSWGIFDEMENLIGFGLVALQTYVTETATVLKLRKYTSYEFGPKTESGVAKIEILNALANFWKHREEWIFDDEQKRKNAADRLFGEVGCSTDMEYPISGVLTELLTPQEVRFSNLIPILSEWRNDMVKNNPIKRDDTLSSGK